MAKLVVQQSKNPTLQLQENVKADNIEEVRILLRNPPSTQLEWWELLKLSGSAEMEDILITALKSLDSMKRLVFNVDIKNSCESEESDSPFPPLIALHLLEDCEDLDPAHYTEYQGSTFLEAAAKKSIQLLTVMISMLKLRSSEEQRRCYEVKNSVGENILGLIVKDAKEKHFDVIRSIITDIPELIGLKSKGWTPLTPMHIAVNGALDAASRGTLDIRLLNLLIQKYPKALRVHTKDGNSPYSQVKVYKLEKWMHRDAEQIIEDIRSFLESRIFSAFSDNISDLRAALYGAKGACNFSVLYKNFGLSLKLTHCRSG
jgi:hypothetical protein